MTEYNTFCDEVLRHVPRATMAERDQIRQELMDHLEDHRDMLLEHGTSQEEAEKCSISSMGSAEEIGWAWNKQLSPFWLWAGRCMKTMCILLIAVSILPAVVTLQGVLENMQGRSAKHSDYNASSEFQAFWVDEPEIVQEFGEHIIRLYRVELGAVPEKMDLYALQVYTISYPKNPLHNALDVNILMDMTCNGKETAGSGGGGSNPGCVSWRNKVYIEKGTPSVTMELEHMGKRFYTEIPLEWGGAP